MTGTRPPCSGPLRAVRCDLCGQSRDRTLLTLPDMIVQTSRQIYRLGRCRSCDLIYLNPRPQPWDLHRYYPEDYAPFSRNRLSAGARVWLHRRSVAELRKYLGAPNQVLDVGCGTGELLQAIRQSGNNRLTGVEPSAFAANIARVDLGLDVRTGTLEDARFPDASFDTVLLSHVLEHMPSPRSSLSEVARILKPGGVVIIWVPNARSLAANLLGRYWMGWDVPRHLYAFTPGTLHHLLEETGLEPGEFLHERHGLEWAWGVRLWARDRFSSSQLDSLLARLHPATGALLTPLGIASAVFGQSGRIRVIGRKVLE